MTTPHPTLNDTLLHTARLRLEPFAAEHLTGLHAMNSQPAVMRYLGVAPESLAETRAWMDSVAQRWAAWNLGWWAFIEPVSGRVAGAGCVQHARREAELPPDLRSLSGNPFELGWRLHPDFWGQGLASEAAQSLTDFAFLRRGAPECIAIRHPDNRDSERVMARLGMRYRGLETWYGETEAVHVLTRGDWAARRQHTIASA
jgi:RimJ/RimL family protein N-acetyltransferase